MLTSFVTTIKCFAARKQDENNIAFGQKTYVNFCDTFVTLFRREKTRPTHHVMVHLADTLRDYGTCYSSWTFSYERMNGLLGRFTTNRKDTELIMMKKVRISLILNNVIL